MIQRIQTVYLLLSCLFSGLMFTMPLAEFMGGCEVATLWAHKIVDPENVISTSHMAVLIAITTILPFINIFMFKRRWLQIRLCLAQMILLVGVVVFLIYYMVTLNSAISSFQMHSMSLQVADIFPVISLILTVLAYRGVVKDEALVKSLDRIR